jgi:hypothetical protein
MTHLLVDQHYASGPDEMKQMIAEALMAAAAGVSQAGDPRERLKQEVDDATKASALGSE